MRLMLIAACALLLGGCGIQPSGVTEMGAAPTGVAPGVTLYFVDADGRLRPQLRETQRLGTPAEAVSLMLTGPGTSGLRTDIKADEVTRVVAQTAPGVIRLQVPLATYELGPLGVDQLVCTALASAVQNGASRATKVQIGFTVSTPEESDRLRTCPMLTAGR